MAIPLLAGPSFAAPPPRPAEERPPVPRLVTSTPPPLATPGGSMLPLAVVRALRERHNTTLPRALLVAESAQLEELVRRTPKNAPDRASSVARLGLSFARLAARARRDLEANGHDADIELSRRLLAMAAPGAIKALAEVAASAEHEPGGDEILYDLARETELAGNIEAARSHYFALLRAHPKSPLVARAYVALGEMFRAEARDDSTKQDLAELCFERAVGQSAKDDAVVAFARFELAELHARKGDFVLAKEAYVGAARAADFHPAAAGVDSLRALSRREAIAAFAFTGSPEDAAAFGSALTGQPATSRAAIDVLDEVGSAWLDAGRSRDAAALYRASLSDAGAVSCRFRARWREASVVVIPRTERVSLLATLRTQAAEAESSDDASGCAPATLRAAVAAAASLHRDALLDPKDDGASAAALAAYDLALGMTSPTVVASSGRWAGTARTYVGAALARGQLLHRDGSFSRCGASYDVAEEAGASGADLGEAARGGVVCWRAELAAAGLGKLPPALGLLKGAGDEPVIPSLETREPSALERSAIHALERFLASGGADASERQRASRDLGALHFALHDFAEAAPRFEEATFAADVDVDLHVATLYLESLDALSRKVGGRLVRLHEMSHAIERLLIGACDAEKRASAGCRDLLRAKLAVRASRGDSLAGEARRTGEAPGERFEQAARLYWETAKSCALDPIAMGRAPLCSKPAALLERSAEAFRAARLTMKSIRVELTLIDPRLPFSKTTEARRALLSIARAYEGISVFDEAATYYERFAREPVSREDATAALESAIRLRLALGHDERAASDTTAFERLRGSAGPAESARIATVVAMQHMDREDWENARKRLASALPALDLHGDATSRLFAHAMHARALTHLGRHNQAETADRRVLTLWRDRTPLEGVSEEDRRRATSAVAESMLRLAEREEKLARSRPLADQASALETVEKSYRAVIELGAPAGFAIVAEAKIGGLWAGLAHRSRGVAPTKALEKRARASFEMCLKRSVDRQLFDETSRGCELWLARTFRGEFIALDEIAPRLTGLAAADRAQPVERGDSLRKTEAP